MFQKCPVCRGDFEGPSQQRYCTRACQVRAYRRRRRGRVGSRPCDQCGQPYVIDPPGKRYCTERCAKAHSNAQQAAKKAAAMIAPVATPPVAPAPPLVDKAKKKAEEDRDGIEVQKAYLKLRLGAGWDPDHFNWNR